MGSRVPRAAPRERGTLLHAEAMLLVDDHEPEVVEVDGVLQERMGADDDAGLARGDGSEFVAALPRGLRAREIGDPRAQVARAEQSGLRERAEERSDGAQVLLGEHLGRGKQSSLRP